MILILVAMVIGVYDKYAVQRDYADLYAARHGHIPPLVEWFTTPDPDEEVEGLRCLHRNLYILGGVLSASAAILVLLSVGSPGG